LTLEYRTVALADSGIYLRALPQVQIWDTREAGGKWHLGADKGSGGLWNNQRYARFPTENRDRPFGEWNHMVIRMVGERTTVDFNGARVVNHVPLENYFDRDRPAPRLGPIQLQTHGGEIRFRNVRIQEITGDEANAILMQEDATGYRPIFDGRTLEGFQGATDDYMVKDGAIQCRSGRGGTLYTEEAFEDFQVRLEFRLPAGGNNGLAIRYPGHGDPAYQGFCELQVLDNTATKYGQLKPYQYHGSAYGMVAAHRGYLRPIGEWNFQEVTVRGTSLKVELNGTTILETDLLKLKDPVDEAKHPGITLRKGHFGFAGHNDPVEFRHVHVRPLKP
ncbi:MAG TPA: DUF1080 domain-containing protein, partial [Planctomycetota bacterium]|nr:DUF1080 domain-containing protein [Planctomycetota bacterium]